jgi:predicted nucleic acid-binding protein
MRYLIDTGILLRLVVPTDPQHAQIVRALEMLIDSSATFHCSTQNIAEFWNVLTRPSTARGGFGVSHQEAVKRLEVVERAVEVLSETPSVYSTWKKLLVTHSVSGVQVHDTKLVALMSTYSIINLLTLNVDDFRRFTHIKARTPQDIILTGLIESS